MKKYFFENKLALLEYLLFAPFAAICSVLFSVSMEPLFNDFVHKDYTTVVKSIIIFILTAIFDMLFYYLRKKARENLRCNFLIGLKRDILAGVMNMDYADYRRDIGNERWADKRSGRI